MAGSESVRSSWSSCIHKIFIHDHFDAIGVMRKCINNQDRLVKKYVSENKLFPTTMHTTLILDDLGCFSNIMKCSELALLASNGRHLQMQVVVIIQHFNMLPPAIRTNVDILFCLSTSNRSTINKISEEFCGTVSLREFKCVLSTATKDRGILVVDNRKSASSVIDHCFHLSVPYPFEEIQLLSKAALKFAEDHYFNRREFEQSKQEIQLALDDSDSDTYEEINHRFDSIFGRSQSFVDIHGRIMVNLKPQTEKAKLD